ncbi:retrotransposon protein, putative, unclassified [Panicum miliaceum]|uniref:Retrotransposon protein, putative, unclassified n=1 Tax=Panicum miliaceum TaxID=4540 RepID=A0A3L6REZ0_PANMI|nr:retrotransposon protein, putative, unclassified [Panicum miliaceum]
MGSPMGTSGAEVSISICPGSEDLDELLGLGEKDATACREAPIFDDYDSDSNPEAEPYLGGRGLVITSTPGGHFVYWKTLKPSELLGDDAILVAHLDSLPFQEGRPLESTPGGTILVDYSSDDPSTHCHVFMAESDENSDGHRNEGPEQISDDENTADSANKTPEAHRLRNRKPPECMRVKQLVTFKMGNKKQVNKGKKDDASTDNWERNKCSHANLINLVMQGLLQSEEMVQWRPSFHQTILFKHFVERGLALPASDFFRGLLYQWGIQVHHLNPNSIVHLSIFVQFCEAFLGIEPYFDLFRYFFHLRQQPSEDRQYLVGGARIQFKQGKGKEYIYYSLPTNHSG